MNFYNGHCNCTSGKELKKYSWITCCKNIDTPTKTDKKNYEMCHFKIH